LLDHVVVLVMMLERQIEIDILDEKKQQIEHLYYEND
jgi:hypothetical protein